MIGNHRRVWLWLIALLAALLLSITFVTLASPTTLAQFTGTVAVGYGPLMPAEQARTLQGPQGKSAIEGLQLPDAPVGGTPAPPGTGSPANPVFLPQITR